jgi:hypothetical protein
MSNWRVAKGGALLNLDAVAVIFPQHDDKRGDLGEWVIVFNMCDGDQIAERYDTEAERDKKMAEMRRNLQPSLP